MATPNANPVQTSSPSASPTAAVAVAVQQHAVAAVPQHQYPQQAMYGMQMFHPAQMIMMQPAPGMSQQQAQQYYAAAASSPQMMQQMQYMYAAQQQQQQQQQQNQAVPAVAVAHQQQQQQQQNPVYFAQAAYPPTAEAYAQMMGMQSVTHAATMSPVTSVVPTTTTGDRMEDEGDEDDEDDGEAKQQQQVPVAAASKKRKTASATPTLPGEEKPKRSRKKKETTEGGEGEADAAAGDQPKPKKPRKKKTDDQPAIPSSPSLASTAAGQVTYSVLPAIAAQPTAPKPSRSKKKADATGDANDASAAASSTGASTSRKKPASKSGRRDASPKPHNDDDDGAPSPAPASDDKEPYLSHPLWASRPTSAYALYSKVERAELKNQVAARKERELAAGVEMEAPPQVKDKDKTDEDRAADADRKRAFAAAKSLDDLEYIDVLSLGSVGHQNQLISARWKGLDPEQRKPWERLHAEAEAKWLGSISAAIQSEDMIAMEVLKQWKAKQKGYDAATGQIQTPQQKAAQYKSKSKNKKKEAAAASPASASVALTREELADVSLIGRNYVSVLNGAVKNRVYIGGELPLPRIRKYIDLIPNKLNLSRDGAAVIHAATEEFIGWLSQQMYEQTQAAGRSTPSKQDILHCLDTQPRLAFARAMWPNVELDVKKRSLTKRKKAADETGADGGASDVDSEAASHRPQESHAHQHHEETATAASSSTVSHAPFSTPPSHPAPAGPLASPSWATYDGEGGSPPVVRSTPPQHYATLHQQQQLQQHQPTRIASTSTIATTSIAPPQPQQPQQRPVYELSDDSDDDDEEEEGDAEMPD